MKEIISNGVAYQFEKALDLTSASELQLRNLKPGYYRIKLHENFGSHELTVLLASSFIYNGTIRITIIDNVGDYVDTLYWNGGWKIDQLMYDSVEEWVEAFDY